MDIKKLVTQIIKKYKTNNPFELAEALGIDVLYENLGSINGYYTKILRCKFIHVNYNLDETRQRYTIAHELGHALLHPNANTPFLREKTLFSVDKLERQANTFAVELLMPDSLIQQYEGYTIHNIADIVGIPNGLEVLKK